MIEGMHGQAFVTVIDCEGCGVESTTQPLFELETPPPISVHNYCAHCLWKRHPEMVEVIE